MKQIFLSYAHEDIKAAEFYAMALEAEGFSVWWDHKILPGQRFEDVIEQHLIEAACMVVLWSKNSIESNFVRAEADAAFNANKYVPVFIDDTSASALPLVLRSRQIAKMPDWERGKESGEWDSLIAAVAKLCGQPDHDRQNFDPEMLRARGVFEMPGNGNPNREESHDEMVATAIAKNTSFFDRIRPFLGQIIGASLGVILMIVLVLSLSPGSRVETASSTLPKQSETNEAPLNLGTRLPKGAILLGAGWYVDAGDGHGPSQADGTLEDVLPSVSECQAFRSEIEKSNLFSKLESSDGFVPKVWAHEAGRLRVCEFTETIGGIRLDVYGKTENLEGSAARMPKKQPM